MIIMKMRISATSPESIKFRPKYYNTKNTYKKCNPRMVGPTVADVYHVDVYHIIVNIINP